MLRVRACRVRHKPALLSSRRSQLLKAASFLAAAVRSRQCCAPFPPACLHSPPPPAAPVHPSFEHMRITHIAAETDITLVHWTLDAVSRMADGSAGAALPGYWRSYALFAVARDYSVSRGARPRNAKARARRGRPSSRLLAGLVYCRRRVGGRARGAPGSGHARQLVAQQGCRHVLTSMFHAAPAHPRAQGELEAEGWHKGMPCGDLADPLTAEEQQELRMSFKVWARMRCCAAHTRAVCGALMVQRLRCAHACTPQCAHLAPQKRNCRSGSAGSAARSTPSLPRGCGTARCRSARPWRARA